MFFLYNIFDDVFFVCMKNFKLFFKHLSKKSLKREENVSLFSCCLFQNVTGWQKKDKQEVK